MAYQERLCLKTFSNLPKRPCSLQRENSKGLLSPGIFTWSIYNPHYNLSIILAIIAFFLKELSPRELKRPVPGHTSSR